ncbi:hypothetical protein DFJ74DRAFT_668107 [Hyaloraphidium curvatum]|nr:hypothetical protein DFJ74DRAFT_668107 [Hyaloraphidium curvatum]
MWTTWRAGFAAWTIFVTVACHVSLLSEIATTDVALLGLESRLKHRVLKLALAGLVSRATRSSARGETISWPFTEPYIDVQMAFAPSWRSNKSSTEIGLVLFVVAASTTALSSLASLLGSGCIPAFYISTVAMDLVFCIRYVSDAIVANGGVSSAVDLYRRTRTTLAGLLALDPDHPERRRLRAHAELLARYEAACSEDLAMLFGFVVRYGVLRGLLVTGLTVGIGLFGILRGAGARVTLQTVCPVA